MSLGMEGLLRIKPGCAGTFRESCRAQKHDKRDILSEDIADVYSQKL
jgi:hypothetical protein